MTIRFAILPFPIYGHFVSKRLAPAVFEILGSKRIGVTTLTFQGHVTSSVIMTIPFRIDNFLFASSDSFSVRRATYDRQTDRQTRSISATVSTIG